jgi:hypothetical protein
LIASTLCWLWGILMALSSVAVLIPAVAVHGLGSGPFLFAALTLLLAAAYIYGGYAIRKQRLAGGWAGAGAAAVMAALQLRTGIATAAGVGLVVNLAILALIVANWRHLRGDAGKVDA